MTALALLGLAAFVSRPPGASGDPLQDSDPAAREWNQRGGNARRTGESAMAPVRAEPVVAWEAGLSGPPASEPVTWGGVVFIATKKGRNRELNALRAVTGERLGAPRGLGAGGRVELAAWQGSVIVWEPGEMKAYPHRGGSFGYGWTRKIDGLGPPGLHDGKIYASAAGVLHVIDARTGRVLEKFPDFGGTGRLSVDVRRGGGIRVGGASTARKDGYVGTYGWLNIFDIGASGSGRPRFPRELAVIQERHGVSVVFETYRIPGKLSTGGWLVRAAGGFKGVSGLLPGCTIRDGRSESGGLSMIVTEPATRDGTVTGFDDEGQLVVMDSEGRYRIVMEKGDLPPGARPGPATLAGGDVVCFGNWAADLATSRVLWCRPGDLPATPAIPVADGFLVYGTEGGTLVALAEPAALRREKERATASDPETGGDPVASSPGAGTEAAPAPSPAGRDLAILPDGRVVEGTVTPAGSGFRVVTPAGEEMRLSPAGAALVIRRGEVLHRGDRYPVLTAWRNHLRPQVLALLEEAFARYARERLLSAAREILAEARTWGIPAVRAEELERSLTDRQENTNAAGRMAALAPDLASDRGKVQARFFEAAAWCRERRLLKASAVLLGDADRILPGSGDVEKRALETVPPGFPWAGREGAGRLWLRWAAELAPAEADFVPPQDPAWREERNPPWTRGFAMVRSPHVLLLSRTFDPAVVGACIRDGEWTVRALAALLGRDAIRPPRDASDRMEVRLHPDRKSYLAEETAGGGHAMPWSAGFFSPSEGISRFFVPEDASGAALGRGLYEVLSHELTHHVLETRWTRAGGDSSNPMAPGYWCVEGVARFLEDQVVEMDRRGLRFDDRTVSSLDITVQAAALGAHFPASRLIGISHAAFGGLPSEGGVEVRLRHSLATILLSPLDLFYEEAGSLVYFLVNERGEEGRRAFFDYLADYYGGNPPARGWEALGFESEEDLDSRFRAFIDGLR